MSEYYLQVEYAPTNRSRCQGCQKAIPKESFRVGIVVHIEASFHQEKWYHVQCLPELPKDLLNIKVVEIENIQIADENDKQLIQNKLKELQVKGKEKISKDNKAKKSIKQTKILKKQTILLDQDSIVFDESQIENKKKNNRKKLKY